jgi:hypothetical protein
MVTDRPLTIVTRSLLSQPRRVSTPSLPDSGARSLTNDASHSASASVSVDASLVSPRRCRCSRSAARARRRHADAAVPAVVGRDAEQRPRERDRRNHDHRHRSPGRGGRGRSHRWTFLVLGIATLLGSVAAIAIQLAPGAARQLAAAGGREADKSRSRSTSPTK